MTADATVRVVCKDERQIPASQHHHGRTNVIADFERYGERWYHARALPDALLDKGGAVTTSYAGSDQPATSVHVAGGGKPNRARRYDGIGDDILGRRFDLSCSMCTLDPDVTGVTLAPILDTLAAAGVKRITLRALAARLS
jgi:hypothetical protein